MAAESRVFEAIAAAESMVRGDPATAQALADTALRALDSGEPSELVGRTQHVLGLARAYQGDPTGAVAHLTTAVSVFASTAALAREGQARCDLASVQGHHLGLTKEAIEGFGQALTIALAVESSLDEGRALGLMGSVLGRIGQLEESERALCRAIELLDEQRDLHNHLSACNNLGCLLTQAERYDEAVLVLGTKLEHLTPSTSPSLACSLRSSLALALAHMGQVERARGLLAENAVQLPALGAYDRVDHGLTLGRVHLIGLRPIDATVVLRNALTEAEQSGLQAPAAECLRHLALACEQSGDLRTALDCERRLRRIERGLIDEQRASMLQALETSLQLRAQEAQNAALLRGRALLRSIVDGDDDLIYAKDEKGRFVLVNQAFLVYWQLSEDEVLGRTSHEVFGSTPLIEHSLISDDAVRQSGVPSQADQAVLTSRGLRTLLNRRMAIQSPDGAPWLLGVARDVTDVRIGEHSLREAVQVAQAANEAKSQFLANMSHEIRTPINGIMGMIGLASRAESPRDRAQYLDLARSSADTLLTIVNDILDFSKVEAGKMTIEQVPFSLPELINDLTRPLALKAAEKGLIFLNQLAEDLPTTPIGDPTRLRQVLTNLLGNAVKFTQAGVVVLEVDSVRLQGDQARLRFAVRDTGIGISNEQRSAIFEAFTQADGSITRRFGGTGLGLAISARLVHLMGGRLEVESRVGEGACFSFELSLKVEPAADATPHRPGPTAPPVSGHDSPMQPSHAPQAGGPDTGQKPFNGLRILLAEDNPVNQVLAAAVVEGLGAELRIVGDGAEALAAMGQCAFDLVLMDVQMPLLDGTEAVRRWRANEAAAMGAVRLPIIAMTAHALSGDRERFMAAGFDGYVSKPFTESQLVNEALRLLLARDTAG